MMPVIDIFSALGERLRLFGRDSDSQRCMAMAIEANGWFTERDLCRAVDAIRTEMLDRDKLAAWLADYTPVTQPRRVAVIMAGNIPLVGFFDLLCVVASGNECHIKPSSKDRVMMDYAVSLLRDIEPAIPIFEYDPDARYDMAIATGGDDANRYFRSHFAGVKSLLRGSRHSVAVLSGEESAEELHGIAEDITSYSGLGCRNVSMLFVPRDFRLNAIAATSGSGKRHKNCVAARAMLTMQRRDFVDCGAFLCIEQPVFSSALSCVSYTRYDDLAHVEQWLAEHDEDLQCVVSNVVPHPRRVPPGRAQYPALSDYADGVDTMSFLTENR
ncbi:MAG: aldehyde dehydrogenase [Alistipes sp.]|nr:aldehyde dehydrogenase [Alistipes sp.]